MGAVPDDVRPDLSGGVSVTANGQCGGNEPPFCCAAWALPLSLRAIFFCFAASAAHAGGLQPFIMIRMRSLFSCLCVFHKWRYELRS